MLAFFMPGPMELIIIGVIVLVPVAVVVALVVALRSRKASDNNPNLKPCPDGHLRILAVCFFVCAVLAFAGAAIQLSILLSLDLEGPIKAVFLASNVPTWLLALGFTLGGLRLIQKKGYVFCIVMSVIACLFFVPVGVYGLVVLLRPEVKAVLCATTS